MGAQNFKINGNGVYPIVENYYDQSFGAATKNQSKYGRNKPIMMLTATQREQMAKIPDAEMF